VAIFQVRAKICYSRHLTFRTRQARSGRCAGRTSMSHRTVMSWRQKKTLFIGHGGRVERTCADSMPKCVACGRNLTIRTRQTRPDDRAGCTRVSDKTGRCSRIYETRYLGRGGLVKKTPGSNVPKYVDCGRHLTLRTRQARPGWCAGGARVAHNSGRFYREYKAP